MSITTTPVIEAAGLEKRFGPPGDKQVTALDGLDLVAPSGKVTAVLGPNDVPGWMQSVAENQPVTMMVGAVRALALGEHGGDVLAHSAGWYSIRTLAWSVLIVAVFAPLATRRFATR